MPVQTGSMLHGRPVAGDFATALFNFVQQGEQFVANVYYTTGDVPTIGDGYALLQKSGNNYFVNPHLQDDFAGIHTFSAAELTLLSDIAKDKTKKDDAAAEAAFNARAADVLHFTITEAQGRSLYLMAVDRNVAAAGLSLIASDPNMAGTHELLALEDLAYNSIKLAQSPILQNAVTNGDRAGAWYYFLTHNGANSPNVMHGLENRRIKEANEFGLYGDGNSTNDPAEALSVVRFLDSKQSALRAYMKGKMVPDTDIEDFIKASYAPGDNELVSEFGSGLSYANVVVAPKDTTSTISFASPPGYNKSHPLQHGNTLVVGGTGNDTVNLSGDLSGILGSGSTITFASRGGVDKINAAGLKSSHTIELEGGGGVVNVAMGTNEKLLLDAPHQYLGTITGFGTDDVIDLAGITAVSATLGPNKTLSIAEAGGGSMNLQLAGSLDYSKYEFKVTSDGHGGSNITVGLPSLDDLLINTSGGEQGFHHTYSGTPGKSYHVDFDPFTIPDSIKISAPGHVYVNSGMISDSNGTGPLSMDFTLAPGSTKVTIDVVGSSSGTAWTLAVHSI